MQAMELVCRGLRYAVVELTLSSPEDTAEGPLLLSAQTVDNHSRVPANRGCAVSRSSVLLSLPEEFYPSLTRVPVRVQLGQFPPRSGRRLE